jgi:hypothetical protein
MPFTMQNYRNFRKYHATDLIFLFQPPHFFISHQYITIEKALKKYDILSKFYFSFNFFTQVSQVVAFIENQIDTSNLKQDWYTNESFTTADFDNKANIVKRPTQ